VRAFLLDDSTQQLAVRASIDLLGDRGGDAPPGGGAGLEHELVRSPWAWTCYAGASPLRTVKRTDGDCVTPAARPHRQHSLSSGSPFPDLTGRASGRRVPRLFVPCRCSAARNSEVSSGPRLKFQVVGRTYAKFNQP
jgi:hypothetical protein